MNGEPFRISTAKVQSFERCRKQYWFRYLSGRRWPESPLSVAGITGTGVHKAMSVLTRTDDVDIALHELDTYLRMPAHKLVGPGTEAYQVAFGLLSAGCTAHEELAESTETSRSELDARAEWPSAGLSVRTRIDRADRINERRYRVVDWKTGNYDDDDETDLQLDIAHLGLRTAWDLPADATVEAVAWNLRLDRKRVRELNREDAAVTMQKLNAYAVRMREADEFEATPNSFCSFCDWLDQCDEGQNRRWDDAETAD